MAIIEVATPSKREEIPEDLIIEVLLRLPVKYLIRSKIVCKTWYRLINNPDFIIMHHKFPTKSMLLIHSYPVVEGKITHALSFRSNDELASILAPDLEIPIDGEREASIIGSCNGIVCLFDWFSILLCNPATREFKQLPPSSFPPDKQFHSQHMPAFGVDSSDIYNFKVISIYAEVGGREGCEMALRAEVYTLKSDTWTQLDWVCKDMILLGSLDTKFCGNSCHWYMSSNGRRDIINSILCFDMHTESFNTMNFPKDFFTTKGNIICLMIVKEYLSVFKLCEDVEEQCIDIWVMKEYGVEESWTILYRIGPLSNVFEAFSFWMNDDALLLLRNDFKLVSYYLNSRDNVDGREFDFDRQTASVVVHSETLVSIK